jgi:hypothetical protein
LAEGHPMTPAPEPRDLSTLTFAELQLLKAEPLTTSPHP